MKPWRTRTACAAAALVLIVSGLAAAPQAGPTRDLPDQQCRLTLPDDTWHWDEQPVGGAVASARNEDGLVLVLTAAPHAAVPATDDRFIAAFEQGYLESAQATKVSGRKLTFVGLPCYELTSQMGPEDRRILAVARAFNANGLGYLLGIVGPQATVRGVGDMEKLFAAFEFTSPPAVSGGPRPAGDDSGEAFARRMGQIAGAAFFFAIIVYLVVRLSRRRKSPPA